MIVYFAVVSARALPYYIEMVFFYFLVSLVFESQYLTNFHNAFNNKIYADTCYVATTGGVVYFPIDGISVRDSNILLEYGVYTASEGLASNRIRDLVFDDEGTLFVVAQDFGLQYKRKGERTFHNYNLPVVTLRKARFIDFYAPSYLLLGTDYGLFVVNTRENLSPDDDGLYPPLLIRDTVRYMYHGRHFEYVITRNCVYGWTPDSVFPLEMPVDSGNFGPLIEVENGLIYSTSNKLVSVYGDVVKTFTLNDISHIVARGDTILIASQGGVYRLWNGSLSRILNGLSSLIIPLEDWIIVTSYSVNREYSPYGPGWRFFDGTNTYVFRSPLVFNLITSMRAKNGLLAVGSLLWVRDTTSSFSKVVIIHDDTTFVAESLGAVNDAVWCVDIDDSGKVWVGLVGDNDLGIYILDSYGRYMERISKLPSGNICYISIQQDTVVALWQQGIYRIHKNNDSYSYEEIFRVDYPFFVTQVGNEGYLIGTENEGLIKIDRAGNVLLRVNPAELNSSLVSVARERNGNIYIGATSGLFIYRSADLKKVVDGNVRDIEFKREYVLVQQDSNVSIIVDDSLIYSFTYLNSPVTSVDEAYYIVRDVLEVLDDGSIYLGGEQGILGMKFLYPVVSKRSLRVFPNPCVKGAKAYVDSPIEPVVYNLAMQKMPFKAEKDGDTFCFDTSTWEKGLYIIFVENKEPAKLLIK